MTKDTLSSTHSKVLDAPLPVRVPAVAEAFDAMQVSVERLRRIYAQTLRVTSGFESLGPLAQSLNASYAVPVRRAGTLLTASFGPRLAATPLLFG